MTKRQKQWLVRILVGGFLGVAVLFLIGAAMGSPFFYGGSSFQGLVLVDGVMVLRLGGQEGLAVAVQILLFFLLGAATGVATLPFADDGAALLRRTLAHFAVTAVLVALLAGLNFGRYGILVWLLLLVVLYLLIWCSRWIGWYLEVAAIRHKLGLAPGPSPFQWRETLPYLGFALLLCLGLPALLRVLDSPGLPILTGMLYPWLLLPVGAFFSALSLGKRQGICPLYPVGCGGLTAIAVFWLYNSTALYMVLVALLASLAGLLLGSALRRYGRKERAV